MRICFLLLLLSSLCLAQPGRYILTNGQIHTATEEAFPGYVVVNGKTIEKVGRGMPPAGEHIDLKGGHLYPGLIDADSTLGLVEVESLRATRDQAEVGFVNPNLVARFAYRAESDLIAVARSQGILYSGVNPLGGIISGQGSVMRLWGWTWEDMTEVPAWALSVEWPRVNLPLSAEGKKKKEALQSAGESLFILDDAFAEAGSYRSDEREDVKWGALKPYAEGQRPVVIRVRSKEQIRSALDWSSKVGVKPILVAGRKVHFFADELAKRGVPVVYVGLFNQNPEESQSYDLHYRTPKLLMDQGVTVALSPMGLAFDARELRDLGGRAHAFGLSKLEALQTITLSPAKILGVADRLGSIEAGKRASFVLADGDILEVGPVVTRAWGEGREIDLTDPQKELYWKYRDRIRELKGQRD